MSTVREAIEAADKEFMAAFNRGDAAGVAALYTADARILPPDLDIMQGRKAIQGFWQGAMDIGCKSCTLTIAELHETEDTVIEVGNYTLDIEPAEGESMTDQGKYLIVWKQEDGAWKLDIDIWNSSLPAAG